MLEEELGVNLGATRDQAWVAYLRAVERGAEIDRMFTREQVMAGQRYRVQYA